MGTTRLDVRMGDRAVPVGELIYDHTGLRETTVFTYHESWVARRDAFAISPSMPLGSGPFYGAKRRNVSALPPPISDGTPDSWGCAIIRAAMGGRAATDLDYLIETDDFLRSGALRYFDGTGPDARALAPPRVKGAPSVPRLLDLEDMIAEARAFEADPVHYRERRAHLLGGEALRNAAGSLGGARPKINARDDEGRLWIVKLAKMDDTFAVARAEVLALHLGRLVGLQVADARVLNTSQRFPVALIRRFDRTAQGGRVPFISGQTFMDLPGTEPSTYVDMADRLRSFGSAPVTDMRELWGRMAFTVLIRNTDDHLRNHGFLASNDGKWRLSPGFDINPDPEEGTTLKTHISEIHGPGLNVEAVIEAAPFFDLTEMEAAARLATMADLIASSWRDIGGRLGMSASDFKAVAPAFEGEQVQAARALGGTRAFQSTAVPDESDPSP